MKLQHTRRTFCLPKLCSLACAGIMLLSASGAVLAEPEESVSQLEMSTDYPGISVKAGDSLSFDLDFFNGSGAGSSVALSVEDIPDGWEGYFEGGKNEVSHVYVKSGDNDGAASFEVTVPTDTSEGTYTIDLLAEGEDMSSLLTLTLSVTEEELGSSAMTTQYAEQEGSSDTSFTFSTTIQNNTPNEQSYSFSSSAPSGWTVSFLPSGESTQVAAITVDARGSQTMDIKVTPPSGVEAGEYTIPISAISATETLSSELTVVITGTYELDLSTPSGRLSFDATANKQTAVTLTLTNSGNVDLQNINLTSSVPTDWVVEFSESTIDVLEAGSSKEVTAYVTPADDAMSGDYVLTLKASNSDSSDSAEFRVTVKTETLWGIVGILLIAAAAGGLIVVFRKFGRR